jgi:hypothetical protein
MKNGIIASFVNRRTRRGGAGGNYGPSHALRVMPILEWFQRSSAWSTGYACTFFDATQRNP